MAADLNFDAEGSEQRNICGGSDAASCSDFRLYKWETAKNVCPTEMGWRLPSEADWTALIAAVGENEAGKKLKSTSGWNNRDDGSSGNGTDEKGFTALPGGLNGIPGVNPAMGETGNWWSSTEDNSNNIGNAYMFEMSYDRDNVRKFPRSKNALFSVRCVKQMSAASGN
jgi:uncharacterized protein (TIGR02145 family)